MFLKNFSMPLTKNSHKNASNVAEHIFYRQSFQVDLSNAAMKKSTPKCLQKDALKLNSVDSNWIVKLFIYFSMVYEKF